MAMRARQQITAHSAGKRRHDVLDDMESRRGNPGMLS